MKKNFTFPKNSKDKEFNDKRIPAHWFDEIPLDQSLFMPIVDDALMGCSECGAFNLIESEDKPLGKHIFVQWSYYDLQYEYCDGFDMEFCSEECMEIFLLRKVRPCKFCNSLILRYIGGILL